VLRNFIRWYVGEDDAEMPARPEDGGAPRVDNEPDRIEVLKRARNELAHNPSGSSIFSFEEEEALSARELQVLFLVADGLRDQKVAEQLGLTETTVKRLVRNIFRKLDTAGRAKIHVPAAHTNM
jgi:DNA-binding NarL/FixJ family response regulator